MKKRDVSSTSQPNRNGHRKPLTTIDREKSIRDWEEFGLDPSREKRRAMIERARERKAG